MLFEDNLSSHKTQEVIDFWQTTKCFQRLYPPDLTHVLQCIDRHIGIQYKSEVYKRVRRENMKNCLDPTKQSYTKLSALKKRVLISQAIGDVHERLCRNRAFRRSFLATET